MSATTEGRTPTDARTARAGLEAGTLSAEAALPLLVEQARGAPTRDQRTLAFELLGDLAGRAYGARWELAERAAFALLELARVVDSVDERRALCLAMGRGFRNAWLLPYIHRRLSDADPAIVAAAATAAGGLGFPALEEAVAELLAVEEPQALRLAAIAALGRMGSINAAPRLVPLLAGDPREAAAALTALTEIRSPLAQAEAVALLAADPEPELVVAAVRYLAELGALEVLPALRRLARDEDAERRTAASFASRAFKAERSRDAGERFLIALTERDRAVRAALARRLRTVPVAEVLEHAEVLIGDDAEGVIQVLAELRAEEVTRHLIALVGRTTLSDAERARAALAIEANEAWERDAVAAIVADAAQPDTVRAAAAQTMGAFVDLDELYRRVGDLAASPSATLRGAFLWALQLAARPARLDGALRKRTIDVVKKLLADPDRLVRRRAAYVAGNLALAELAADLLAGAASADADHRVAVFVAIGELRAQGSFAGTLELARKGEVVADAAVQIAALRALSAIVVAHPGQPLDLGPLAGRLTQLLADGNPLVREAAVRVAGLARGAVAPAAIAKLAGDPSPRVRAEVLTALGRLGAGEAEAVLIAGFEDADPAIHERAALALVELGGRRGLDQVLAFVGGEGDDAARAHVAARLTIPPGEVAHVLPVLDATLARLGHDDAAFEPLLEAKVALLEARGGAAATPADVDQEIVGAFPSFAHMVKLKGFETLVKSLRTAEALYRSTTGLADADQSPPIVLWMKCLENYVHAWLGAKLNVVQREPVALFDYVDRVTGAWPGYQRYVGERWRDQVELGTAKVDVPARSLVNALREFQEHKRKRLDSPLSVTEWARLIVFFAVDHASGVRNLFKLPARNADQVIRLAHRLHTLAAVRNLVAHRAAATGSTLDAFRKSYYLSFEDLAQMA
ncbi:MAG TPA: HEAT repeat domain-containing protein [Kofleriaceae bacterium]|nr:HEAT repeat domain-containing protein [Kofleriaceae bacterium]